MAQANPGDKGNAATEVLEEKAGGGGGGFKLNAEAPEFVPRSHAAPVSTGFFHPWYGFMGSNASDWFRLMGQEPLRLFSDGVEYQLSNANLLANDSLMKLMSKDPEGFVPISAVTSLKKIKSLGSGHRMLATALRASTKLVVSEDGNRVKRKQAFTERDKEELQSRTVVVENLPEDHSRKNLEKIFGVVGSIKNIRICHPQDPNTAKSSKGDFLISNKLHALVEYETADQAEKAAERLNDERNWRKGLRVRPMLRRSPRSVIRGRKADYDPFGANSDDEEPQLSEPSGSSQPVGQTVELIEENASVGRKGWAGRGRGKPRGGGTQAHNGRGLLSPSPHAGALLAQSAAPGKQPPRSPRLAAADGARGILSPSPQPAGAVQPEAAQVSCKQSPRGPRMPDGTRGFAMGRGKPVGAAACTAP
ncbi:hypothetical protein Taro_019811 [Colocasia esculenta]|uniref:La-related protein 6C n=1 Tax=Colocasia esculenta TaxID=4460 RepID=A0A843UUR4_COLES|nr:hypothetical protein [Colocasia esculenta]